MAVGVKSKIEDIELDESGRPLAKRIDWIVKCLAILAMFLFSLNMGWHARGLSHSPLVFIVGYISSFLLMISSWVYGLIIFGLLAGRFSFANSLFELFRDIYFRTGIALLCFTFFPARILSGALIRLSYLKKQKSCFCLAVFILVNFILLFRSMPDKARYAFVYLTAFVYYAIFSGPKGGRIDMSENLEDRRK